MKPMRFVLLWMVALASGAQAGFEVPGGNATEPIAFVGATLHVTVGGTIENGVLVMEDGKIVAVGAADKVNSVDARTLNLKGKHIYPGLIDADTSIGLVEIEAVRATRDHSEAGHVNPNVKALIAFNPDSELIPVARADGVLLALSVPRGGFIRGQSSLMMLDGWTGNEMALLPQVGMHIRWPSAFSSRGGDNEKSARERTKERKARLEQLRQSLDDARAYQVAQEADKGTPFDPRLDALAQVTAGKLRLFVHADDVRQIQEAVALANREDLGMVLVGGYDAEQCAELLKEHDIPVIITGTYRLPRRRHEAYDTPFTLPVRLQKAGVRFCLSGNNRFSASAVRNLAQHAGTASAFGLPPEEAIKAITLNAAKILGAGDRVGSLEKNKDATLIISDGDILEVPTNVEQAYIQGRPVDLNNRHKRLYEKYKIKYERLAE